MDIANILFDFGNVIIDIDIEGAKSRLLDLMDEQYDTSVLIPHVESLIRKYEVNAVSTDEFINNLKKFARRGVKVEDIVNAWNSMLIGIPAYRFGMLEELKSRCTTMLLSNTNALHIDWVHNYLMNSHGIEDFEKTFFHAYYYSYKIRKRKPDAEYFNHVIEDAMITPARSLFIDDVGENIARAKAMGFQTIHIKPGEEIAEILKFHELY